MNQVVETPISKSKEAAFSRKLDQFLMQLRDNNRATLEIRKEIGKLQKANEKSYSRAKKAVDALAKY